MKKLFAVFLAAVLACSCLAGCGFQRATNSSGIGSIGTTQEETKEKFVDLDTGEKAFSFTAEEFKNNFNNLTSKSEQKIEDWERVVEGDSVFYRYRYGENFYLGITEDSEEEFVKFLMLSYGLLDGNDANLWGEVTSILFSVVDSTLDSAARKDLLEELEIADVDSWYIGKEGYTIKNDISYGITIDESQNVILTIMPVPDFSSSTSASSYPSSEAPSSEAPSSQEPPQPTEQVLLDQNGIKITFTGIEEERSRVNIKLKIENNTEAPIMVQQRDMSVNGIMMDGIFSPTIAAGKLANDEITIYSSDLEENSITQIENVELKFLVFNDDTLDTILESQVIAFNIQ